MIHRDLPLFEDETARSILEELCKEHRVSLELLEQLLSIQRANLGRGKQIGISQEFSAAISEFIESYAEAEDAAD